MGGMITQTGEETLEQARAVTRFSFQTRGARSVGDERCVPSLGFLDGMEWITPLLSGSPLIFRRKKGRGGSGRGREEEVGGLVGESNPILGGNGRSWSHFDTTTLCIVNAVASSRVSRVESTST